MNEPSLGGANEEYLSHQVTQTLPVTDPLCLAILDQLIIMPRTQRNRFRLKDRQQGTMMKDPKLQAPD